MSAKAKRAGHLELVRPSVPGRRQDAFADVSAEEFAREMRGLIRSAAESVNGCRQEEAAAWEAAEQSVEDVINGPAEAARKRMALRRVNKFAFASKFVELTAIILHRVLGEDYYSPETVGTGLGEEERRQVAYLNAIGRRALERGGR